jgi:hypothetical protein
VLQQQPCNCCIIFAAAAEEKKNNDPIWRGHFSHAALQIFLLSYFQTVVLLMACSGFVYPAPIRTSSFLIHVDAQAEAFDYTILENICGLASDARYFETNLPGC